MVLCFPPTNVLKKFVRVRINQNILLRMNVSSSDSDNHFKFTIIRAL